MHAPSLAFWLIIAALFVVVGVIGIAIEAKRNREWQKGLLFGGGSCVLAFCLLYWPSNTLTLVALTVVMGGVAYGLAKVLHH
jgi:uncharacterized membrane protein HdeD (DUF308 family)